ncbi:MAG: Sjogren's syndrome/scleroderma autoantigen 1 family protein [Candidatus Bathyarchaeales archaeon]
MSSNKPEKIQNMVNLLKQGATLTEYACPVCATPLFKLKNGQFYCAQCEKRVLVVKEGETPTDLTSSMTISSLEATLLSKIEEIEKRIREEKDVEQLQKLSDTLNTLLENLEKTRKTKR